MQPEMPFLAAGAISIAGGVMAEKAFPADGVKSIMGTVVLVLAASSTTNMRIAPLIHAIGMLLVLGAIIGAVNKYKKVTPSKGPIITIPKAK